MLSTQSSLPMDTNALNQDKTYSWPLRITIASTWLLLWELSTTITQTPKNSLEVELLIKKQRTSPLMICVTLMISFHWLSHKTEQELLQDKLVLHQLPSSGQQRLEKSSKDSSYQRDLEVLTPLPSLVIINMLLVLISTTNTTSSSMICNQVDSSGPIKVIPERSLMLVSQLMDPQCSVQLVPNTLSFGTLLKRKLKKVSSVKKESQPHSLVLHTIIMELPTLVPQTLKFTFGNQENWLKLYQYTRAASYQLWDVSETYSTLEVKTDMSALLISVTSKSSKQSMLETSSEDLTVMEI